MSEEPHDRSSLRATADRHDPPAPGAPQSERSGRRRRGNAGKPAAPSRHDAPAEQFGWPLRYGLALLTVSSATVLIVRVWTDRWDRELRQVGPLAGALLIACLAVLLAFWIARRDALTSLSVLIRRVHWSYWLMASAMAVVFAVIAFSDLTNKDKIVVGGVLLVVGLVLAWFTVQAFGLKGETHFLAMVVLPVVFYLLLAGYVSGLSLPGGVEVQLSEIAREPASAAQDLVLRRFVPIVQGGVVRGSDEGQYQEFCGADANALVATVATADYSARELVKLLGCNKNIRFLVFLDRSDKLVGYVRADTALTVLSDPNAQVVFDRDVAGGLGQPTVLFPYMRTEAIAGSPSVGEVLEATTSRNLEAIAIVDSEEGRHFQGIIEREELLSRMLLDLVDD